MSAAARSGRTIPPEAVGMAVLALHNLAVHRLLPAPAGAALNLATAAGLSSFARHAGCSRADLGIGVEDAGRGLRVGLGAAAVAGGGVALGAALPATRRFFGDRRVSDVGRGEVAYHLTLRIPLATALAEEVLFRGVLLALFRRRRSPAAAVLWTSLLFGAWHVLPTIDHYQGNPASDLVADPSRGRRLAVVATTLSTTGAGGVFAWLRLQSRSVLAPVLAHAAVNVSAYLAGRLVVNRQARSDGRPGGRPRIHLRRVRTAHPLAGQAARAMAQLREAL
jgi:membrane protease YdiL (CAAX protease family)